MNLIINKAITGLGYSANVNFSRYHTDISDFVHRISIMIRDFI